MIHIQMPVTLRYSPAEHGAICESLGRQSWWRENQGLSPLRLAFDFGQEIEQVGASIAFPVRRDYIISHTLVISEID